MRDIELVLKYEARELTQEEGLAMFASLVASGDIWRLPMHYLDTAAQLFEHGYLSTVEKN